MPRFTRIVVTITGDIWRDVQYSTRVLAAHRGFATAGVLVLALGMGVNTAIFSVVNAVLFRPLPVRAADELRYLYTVQRAGSGPYGGTSYREFLELRARTTAFSDVLLAGRDREKVRANGIVETAVGEHVSVNYFDVLGVQPFIGRAFTPGEDEAPTGQPIAIISHEFWQSRFRGDPNVLGKTLQLTQRSAYWGAYSPWKVYTIVGVMPRGFKGLSVWEPTQFWLSFVQWASGELNGPRYERFPERRPALLDFAGLPVGRLKPGVTDEQARAETLAIAQGFRSNYRADAANAWSLAVVDSLHVRMPFDPRGQIVPSRLAAALMGVSGVLLMIGAANLAGMLMARSISRRQEIAVRLALGAGRWRVMRQLSIDGLLLSIAGGLFGLLAARWLVDLFIAGTPTQFVRWQISAFTLDVPIDGRVLLVTAASCLVTGLFLGAVTARHALRVDVLSGLAGGFAATRAVRTSLGRWIVIPQVCLSIVLLLVAGILVRTVVRAELIHPGYEADGVVLLDFEIPHKRFEDWMHQKVRNAASARLLERAAAAPGVEAVALTVTTPIDPLPLPNMRGWVAPREGFRPDGKHYWPAHGWVSRDYFRAMQIPLLRGRTFDDRDTLDSPPVVIVSEALARQIWPEQDPIGQYLGMHEPNSSRYPDRWIEVVGVAGDVDRPLDDSRWNPAIYRPLDQFGMNMAFTLVARGNGTPASIIQTLTGVITSAEPDAISARGRTLDAAVGELLYPRRVAAALLTLAGAIGLALASTGLYGLVAFSVAQRLREIGVRMALGADGGDIRRMILREGLTMIATGVVLGFALAFAAIRLTSRFVAPLPPADALTFLAVPLLLGAAILLACYLPAARAARVDPIEVLRSL